MQLPSSTAPTNPGSGQLSVTWLGHATFLLRSSRGVRVLFDPWLAMNPACPPGAKKISSLDLMLITHGHSDHCGDAMTVWRDTGATVVAPVELAAWLERQGLKNARGM